MKLKLLSAPSLTICVNFREVCLSCFVSQTISPGVKFPKKLDWIGL